MLVWNQQSERARYKQLKLIPLLVPKHTASPPMAESLTDNRIRHWGLFQRPHDAPLPGRLGEELRSALAEPQAGIRDDQPDAGQAALLELLEERAPARLVLFGALADAENLPITLAVHANRHQKRYVANLAGPAALEHEAIEINIGVLALD